eukprot:CAMPEP_0204855260 /NCGR_PEP_ID=MMETSP1347-20130617/16468_1 /ASSEMBLY_ACC=CAM_ASM_000690 /TAXON_ID=215587 /ORGANISM="Aplanochytrium stocchinoi, Strain GSBS06" /LENGTH=36 /DNA_ID= /DNA_START= /DNA_END= /DNA_ORIENTATION=
MASSFGVAYDDIPIRFYSIPVYMIDPNNGVIFSMKK